MKRVDEQIDCMIPFGGVIRIVMTDDNQDNAYCFGNVD